MVPLTPRRFFVLFARVGNLTFGGGDPTMTALQSELFGREWLTPERYGLIYSLARVTPGTNILAFCAGVGWQLLGLFGAVLAVTAVSLPSSALVVVLTAGYRFWKSDPLAMAAIAGTLAAAVGMMATGAYNLLRPQMRSGRWLRALTVGGAALLASVRYDMSPVQILGVAALIGLVWR